MPSTPNPLAVRDQLEASDHSLTVVQWAAFLLRAIPSEYRDRPPPKHPTAAMPGSEGKIDVMMRRVGRGRSPCHSADARWDQADSEGVDTARRMNGSTERLGLRQLPPSTEAPAKAPQKPKEVHHDVA